MMTAYWQEFINEEFKKDYYKKLESNINQSIANGVEVYPPKELTFLAFELTPFEDVKVVIIGQDPYIKPHEAMGLAFSVPGGVTIPPSLRNIFKELRNEYQDFIIPQEGDLTSWAKQGVFLINKYLSVERGKPLSHANFGWDTFTDNVIKALNEKAEHLVFMLWGNFARSNAKFIDSNRHLVLQTSHPSPLGAHKGFLGCNHFIMCNDYLKEHGKTPIDWQLVK